MAAEWYYAKNKQKVGPVTEAQLQELVRSGELSPTDMVWKQGMAKWQPAGAVDGLLPQSPPAPPEPPRLPDATSAVRSVWWERLNRNKPAYLSALLAVALFLTCLCSPVVNFVLGAFPEGLGAFLGFLYVLFMIGLFVALVVAGFVALFQAAKRAERLKYLWGKWEPVSGEGCSLWFYQDGGFMRNDGFGAKYVYDLHQDIIRVNVAGFGQTIPLKVITITKHELIVDGGNQALHFKKGKTITDERWEESVEKTKEFLKQAAIVTGAVAVGVVALGALVLGATAMAAGGMAAAGAAGGGFGGSSGPTNGGGSSTGSPSISGPRMVESVCGNCSGKGWLDIGTSAEKRCGLCGGTGVQRTMK
jgi:hypothetical protein